MQVLYTLIKMLLWTVLFTLAGLLLATGFVTAYAAIPPLTAITAVVQSMLPHILSISVLTAFSIILLLLKTYERKQRVFLIGGGILIHIFLQWIIWTAFPVQDFSELVLDDFYSLSPSSVVRNPDNSSFLFFQRVSANQLKDVVSNVPDAHPRLSVTPLMNYDPLYNRLSPANGGAPVLTVNSQRKDELLSVLGSWLDDLIHLTSRFENILLNESFLQFFLVALGISFFFMGMYLPFSLFFQNQAFTILTAVLMFRLFAGIFAWFDLPAVQDFIAQITTSPPSPIFFTMVTGIIGLILFIIAIVIIRKKEQL